MTLSAKQRLGFGLVAAILIGLGARDVFARYTATTASPRLAPKTVVSSSRVSPSEASINVAQDEYVVAANLPRLITLPTIRAKGFIQQVGIDATTRQMAVPNNIHLAGWYTGSVKPGETGVSIIDGHVSGHYQPGIFADLSKVRPGSRFNIEYGDGSIRTFEVVSTTSYPVAEVAKYLYAKEPNISKQLNLITCGGKFNNQQQQYEKRILSVARRIR